MILMLLAIPLFSDIDDFSPDNNFSVHDDFSEDDNFLADDDLTTVDEFTADDDGDFLPDVELPVVHEHSVDREQFLVEELSELVEEFIDSRSADATFSEFDSAKLNESNISTKLFISN